MARQKLWFDGSYVTVKVKLYKETHARYVQLLNAKHLTAQEDLEQHVINSLSPDYGKDNRNPVRQADLPGVHQSS